MGYNGICLWFSESSLYKSSAKTLWFSASVPLSGFVPWWWRYTVSPSVHPTNIRVYMRIYIYTRIYIYMFRSRYLHMRFSAATDMVIRSCQFHSQAKWQDAVPAWPVTWTNDGTTWILVVFPDDNIKKDTLEKNLQLSLGEVLSPTKSWLVLG